MSEIIIEKKDHKKTFVGKRNDVVIIRLEENISTGYIWEVEKLDNNIVELLETDHNAEPADSQVGGSGTRSIGFRLVSSGDKKIRVRLRRQWDPEDEAIDNFEVTIKVL